jgi:thiol-disulfide isomerase/thioredoxin
VKSTRRTSVIAIVAALAVTACGDGGGPVADPATNDSGDAAPLPDGPVATVAPDIPEELVGLIGPVEVIGDPLPPLVSNDFTSDPAVGTPAPVLVGVDYDGNPIRIDAEAAGPTMVVFLAHWCSHCNAEIPVINQLRDDGRIPDDVNVVAVSTAISPGQPNFPPDRWLDDKDWSYRALADGVDMTNESFIGASAFGVTGFPFVALLDDNGNVAARWSGGRPPSEIASLLAALPSVA